jgi:hypothetical protein
MNWETRFWLMAALGALVLLGGCSGEPRLEVKAGVDACHQCNMVIDQVDQACGYIEDGGLVPFDSPGCLLRSFDERRAQGQPAPAEVFFAVYDNKGEWQSSDSVAFLLTTHRPTVMNSGVLCFSSANAAESLSEHPDERVTDWMGYRTARGRPDKIVEVIFAGRAMAPEVVEVAKGEIVLWKATGSELEEDLEFSIKGYPEVGSVTVPAGGGETSFRFLAAHPGSGFPVIETKSGAPLGRVRVVGAHTMDEEAM